ncbi:EF-hand domain-containing protein [Burkholderia ambifaria]|nr:EF-hand domain-containing protein [Burkholderia ambifaria]
MTYVHYVLLFGGNWVVCLHLKREGLIMSNLTDDQIKQIKIRFDEYDDDKDGIIVESEFKKILGEYLSDDEVNKMLKNMDTDENGGVSLDEFSKANY